jgi:hypothetical protein
MADLTEKEDICFRDIKELFKNYLFNEFLKFHELKICSKLLVEKIDHDFNEACESKDITIMNLFIENTKEIIYQIRYAYFQTKEGNIILQNDEDILIPLKRKELIDPKYLLIEYDNRISNNNNNIENEIIKHEQISNSDPFYKIINCIDEMRYNLNILKLVEKPNNLEKIQLLIKEMDQVIIDLYCYNDSMKHLCSSCKIDDSLIPEDIEISNRTYTIYTELKKTMNELLKEKENNENNKRVKIE